MTRVLVVDDSPTTRRIVRRALVMSGVPEMGISEAEDGREALNKICAEKPSLVLSDVNMPIMDGFQLLTEMGSRGLMDRTSVVVITSRSSKKDRGRLLELGAKTVIKKPFPVLFKVYNGVPFLRELRQLLDWCDCVSVCIPLRAA